MTYNVLSGTLSLSCSAAFSVAGLGVRDVYRVGSGARQSSRAWHRVYLT